MEIKIVSVREGEVSYTQQCPGSNICLGGTAKEGETITIYDNEIKPALTG